MNKYAELLINEIQLANELYSILEDEKSCLEANEVELLFELAKQKNSIVDRFNHLEEERKHLDANLEDEEIKTLQNDLILIVDQCSKKNAINGAAISLSRTRIQKQLGLLLGEQNYVSLYSANGLRKQSVLIQRYE